MNVKNSACRYPQIFFLLLSFIVDMRTVLLLLACVMACCVFIVLLCVHYLHMCSLFPYVLIVLQSILYLTLSLFFIKFYALMCSLFYCVFIVLLCVVSFSVLLFILLRVYYFSLCCLFQCILYFTACLLFYWVLFSLIRHPLYSIVTNISLSIMTIHNHT